MTLQDIRGRGLLLQCLGEFAVRVCTSSNSRTFSIAITAWSAKVVTQLDLLLGEWAHLLCASNDDDADRLVLA